MSKVRSNKARKITAESATSAVSVSSATQRHASASTNGPKYQKVTVSKTSDRDDRIDVPLHHSQRWLALLCIVAVGGLGVGWIGYAKLLPNDHHDDIPEPVPTHTMSQPSEQHEAQLPPRKREVVNYAELVPPPEPKHSAFHTTLENSCGIQYAPTFLSTAEIKHVLSIVRASGGWESSKTGGPKYLVPAGQYTGEFTSAVNADPIIKRIEDRIANATGIPIHSLEDMISLAKIKSRGTTPRKGYFVPFGLHHETDTRPNRARTVLIYLIAPKEGGRTLFPLCGPEQTSQTNQDVETLQE